MKLIANRIETIGSENAFKLVDDIRRCEQMGMKVIRFNLGEPDFNSADFINKVGMDNIAKGNSHYCPPAGLESFRKAIAKQISETRGIDADPERVIATVGGKPPIGYTLLTYVNPGDEVIYPSPGFPIYESWVTFVGARAVPLHLNEETGFRFTAKDLEKLITPKTKVIFINSPSNPTGGMLMKEDLEEIAQVIRKKCHENVRIYSDEIYEYITFDGLKHASIASLPGMKERTVLVSGHSKTFAMTGWRLGYALLPTVEEAQVFKNLNINLISCVPPFVQEAGREAYENPAKDSVIRTMVTEFQRRRDYIVPALNAIDGIRCQMPKGAFYVFPNISGVCENLEVFDAMKKLPAEIRSHTTPSTIFQKFLLYRYGVATMDRKSFGQIGSEKMHFLRISIATKMEILEEGIEKIRKAVKDRDGLQAFAKEGKYLT